MDGKQYDLWEQLGIYGNDWGAARVILRGGSLREASGTPRDQEGAGQGQPGVLKGILRDAQGAPRDSQGPSGGP